MIRIMALVLAVSLMMSVGCERDSGRVYAPIGDGEQINMSFTLDAGGLAMAGNDVYITGSVTDFQLIHFGTYVGGNVNGTYTRSVWGNEHFNVGFWLEDDYGRFHRILNVWVNGIQLTETVATDFEVYRGFQLYVDDEGQVQVDTDTGEDKVMDLQVWYTGNTLPPGMNDPADPDDPIFWKGTWTTFNGEWPWHSMVWENNMWTAEFKAARGAMALIRLENMSGEERRSGVFVGSSDDFNNATELINLRELGDNWFVFEFYVEEDGSVVNPRSEDERIYTISIGDE